MTQHPDNSPTHLIFDDLDPAVLDLDLELDPPLTLTVGAAGLREAAGVHQPVERIVHRCHHHQCRLGASHVHSCNR